jgi:cell division protein FtsB
MNLTFLNVTWWKPESIWFKSTYPVHVCGVGCGYVPATIYVVQYGVRVVEPSKTPLGIFIVSFAERQIRRFCARGIAMVDPVKIIVLNPTTQVWISEVYCLYGNNWFWLRLLQYIFREEFIGEEVEAVNFTDTSVNVRVLAKPPGDYVIPAGWYLDPATKNVFRIPGNDTAVMAELQRLRLRISDLEAELANKTAQLAQLNTTAAQFNLTIAQLNAALAKARGEAARLAAENQRLMTQLEALNYTRVQLEAEAYAYKSQLEALRASVATQLTQLTAENQALKAQIASMNETLAKLNEDYASQTAQLQSQLEAWTRAAWIGAAAGAAAGAAVTALALRRRK